MGEVGFGAVSPVSAPLVTENVEQKEVVSSAIVWGLSTGENHNQPLNIPVSAPSFPHVWDLCGFGKRCLELEVGRASCYGGMATLRLPSTALHRADQALLGKSGGKREIIREQ